LLSAERLRKGSAVRGQASAEQIGQRQSAREVFRPLIRQAAACAVVAHNHPSGDSRPSPEDIALTRRLRVAGDILGIPILDHVVVGRDDFTSVGELVGADDPAREEVE